ncbi:hypothetical protein QAD02_004172 [Eretmocerus hayati]|uniref:Uncharacterized protein n=1 Tax=Eretmocerus hayati TaxID=131215 RepID=A0ACC2NQL5_9HYME|nr:hypothetical protein QAD02_004172 [Eretmocerus hayati]
MRSKAASLLVAPLSTSAYEKRMVVQVRRETLGVGGAGGGLHVMLPSQADCGDGFCRGRDDGYSEVEEREGNKSSEFNSDDEADEKNTLRDAAEYQADCQGYRSYLIPREIQLLINDAEFGYIRCTFIGENSPHSNSLNYTITGADDGLGTGAPVTFNKTVMKLNILSEQLDMFKRTGWYACAESGAEIYDQDRDEPIVAWIHVEDTLDLSKLITDGKNFPKNVEIERVGTISCNITTSLSYSPTKQCIWANKVKDILDVTNFHRKAKSSLLSQAKPFNQYLCQHYGIHIPLRMSVYLKLPQRASMILVNGSQYISSGSTLRVKCMITLSVGHSYFFTWAIPQKPSSYKVSPIIVEKTESDMLTIVSELVKDNATRADEGEYMCNVEIDADSHETRAYIYVIGDPVEFSVNVIGYPAPTITWRGPDGVDVMLGSKYTVRHFSSRTALSIEKAQINDMGWFTVFAETSQCKNESDFYLVVIDLEVSLTAQPWYMLNEDATFTCESMGHPLSKNISWFYTKCSQLDSVPSCQQIEVKEQPLIVDRPKYQVSSRATIVLDSSGKIECTACNEHICRSSEINFTAQVPEPASISGEIHNGTQKKIEKHVPFILFCPGNGTPPPTILWYKDGNPFEYGSPGVTWGQNNQSLLISSPTANDSGKYTCVVENKYGQTSLYQYATFQEASDAVLTKIANEWIASTVFLMVILIVLLTWFFRSRNCRKKAVRQESQISILMNFDVGALDCMDPNLMVTDQAELLPYDKIWEFPRDRLKLGKILGSGAFGVVVKAEALGIIPHQTVTTVAVKMLHRNTDLTHLRALAAELKILAHIGKHLNIVNLLGACTNNIDKRELLVIVEYCCFGNLRDRLLNGRSSFIDQRDPGTRDRHQAGLLRRTFSTPNYESLASDSAPITDNLHEDENRDTPSIPNSEQFATNRQERNATNRDSKDTEPMPRSIDQHSNEGEGTKALCTQDLFSWAFQVARGMEYLSQKKVLHGDLAARNILLAKNNVVKICDFGLSKAMYKYENYQKKGDGPLPVKWMAIESIRDRVFSTQSDIWSFGIVLWEFFTLGETPYPSIRAHELLQKLDYGYRMEQPKYATHDVHKMMLWCWESDPKLRPSFTQLIESIGNCIKEGVGLHYLELKEPYVILNRTDDEKVQNSSETIEAPRYSSPAIVTTECIKSAGQKPRFGSLKLPQDKENYFDHRTYTLIQENTV